MSYEPPARRRLLVIGAGVGGLSVALRLGDDYDVTIVERDSVFGGVARTVACAGRPVELGPSHHLEKHENLRELLRYGVPETPDVEFGGGPSEVVVCPEMNNDPIPLPNLAVRERSSLENDETPERTCVPWADETRALMSVRAKDALESIRASDGPENGRLTARLGYQETFARVAGRLSKEKNVRILCDTVATRVEREGCALRVACAPASGVDDPIELGPFDAVVVAASPSAIRDVVLPPDARVPTDDEIVPVASARTVLCFPRGEVPSVLAPVMRVGTHYVSDAPTDVFRWAVALSSEALLVSYVDGERAKRQLRGDVSVDDVVNSFLQFSCRHELIERLPTSDELARAATHRGGSMHAFHAGRFETGRFETGPSQDANVHFVGEAYGPVELRAWMEGACVRAKQVSSFLLHR
jgi:hypothetical protein